MPEEPARPPSEAQEHGSTGESWFVRGPEKFFKGSWGLIEKIGGFFGRRIKGVTKGAWEATAGQIGGEFGEIGSRMGISKKEQGIFNNIAGVIETINTKIADALGGTVSFVTGAPGRIAGRVSRAVQTAFDAIFGIKHEGGGGEAAAAA